MSNLTERHRLILTIAVSVVLTGVLLFLVFSDRGEIDTIEEEIGALDIRLRAAELERRKIPAREEQVLTFRAVEPRELAVLPTEQRISDFHRNLSTFLSAADVEFRELPESSPEDSELAKGIRVTRNKLKLRGESASILKFVNMIENDPRLVSVKGFKMQAGDVDRDNPDAPVMHEFEVALETYFYRPSKAAITREHIPGAEERLQEPRLRAAIDAFQPETPDTYVLRPAVGRRDPLVDPRRTRETVDPEEREHQWQREEATVLDYENRFREIAESLEMEEALRQQQDYFREDRLKRTTDSKINELRVLLDNGVHSKSVQLAELVGRVQIVAENLKKVRGRRPDQELVITRAVMEKPMKDLRCLLAEGNYVELQTRGTENNSFLRGKKVTPEARPLIEEMHELIRKAKLLAEFQAIPIQVKGVMVDREHPERSLVQVNGNYVRAGDRLDETGDLVLQAIDITRLTLQYKGLTIHVPTREGAADKGAPKGSARG